MKIAIVGAGIAGLTTAIALKEKKIATTLFEAAPEIKPIGAGLGLGPNALKAFKYLGLKEELLKSGQPIERFKILNSKGKTITKPGEQGNEEGNFAIHRARLQDLLLSKTDVASIHFNKKLSDVVNAPDSVSLKFSDGSAYSFDYVIFADGIHSLARQKLLPGSKPRYAGYTCWRAVIDNSKLNISESSETWGPCGRFGIVPLTNKQLYWFACINTRQNNPTMASFQVKDLLVQFRGYHSQIKKVLEATHDDDLIWSDIVDIKPIREFTFDRILLIGDAAHATTPNMGQGACQAIEDAVILSKCLAENKNYASAFRSFEQLRLKRVHWITETSWKIGKIAQLENKLLIGFRNTVFKLLPTSVGDRQLKKAHAFENLF